MPTVDNHGIPIHYEVHGSGHPVVLVHGGTVSFKNNYADFGWIESLNDNGLQVIGLDLRGHGKSGTETHVSKTNSSKQQVYLRLDVSCSAREMRFHMPVHAGQLEVNTDDA